jgi:hypothetical protein
VIKTKMKDIPPKELEFMLKDYTLNLERQLEWAGRMLKETELPANVKTKQAK